MKISEATFGNILGSLLTGDRREVTLQITCKVVEEEQTAEDTEALTAAAEKALPPVEEEDIPRPLSRRGRIDGIKALAQFLGCAPSTAQRYKNEGAVPYYERGCRVYFYQDEVGNALRQDNKRNA